MAQNIPMGLLQTAQQQFSQGTAAPTQAGTVGVGGGGSSSMETLEGMMAMGGAAQKLAQQRNLENQKGLQRLFAEAGVGSQGLLNTLGIGLGNALGQRSAEKNPDGAMQNAIAIDNIMQHAMASGDPGQIYSSAKQLIAMNEFEGARELLNFSSQIERGQNADRQFKLSEDQLKLAKDREARITASTLTDLVGTIYAEGRSYEEAEAMARRILGLDPATKKVITDDPVWVTTPPPSDKGKVTTTPPPAKKPPPNPMRVGDITGKGDFKVIMIGENKLVPVAGMTADQITAIRAKGVRERGAAGKAISNVAGKVGSSVLDFINDPENKRAPK